MKIKVLIGVPDVDKATNTLDASLVDGEVFSSRAVKVVLDPSVGDEAVALKGDRVRIVQDASVCTLPEAEIVEVREA